MFIETTPGTVADTQVLLNMREWGTGRCVFEMFFLGIYMCASGV